MAQNTKMVMPLQPKAIHDEMNSTFFDEFGRMQATLGIEAQPPTPGQQNVTLYPYVNPQTELIDATNLPKNDVVYDGLGLPDHDVEITPIASNADGTQIWRITHNGVYTHPIHFHLYDVQVLNRVAWDNIIVPDRPTELGWKDTVRISPLQDTTVALRPIIPELPWDCRTGPDPNPMMPTGSTRSSTTWTRRATDRAHRHQLVNFGWEYVYHCHILTHEEMDMMRPVSVAMPPVKPYGLVFVKSRRTLSWTITRSPGRRTWWSGQPMADRDLRRHRPVAARCREHCRHRAHPPDPTYDPFTDYQYRVVAKNTVGYLDGAGPAGFQEMTVQSVSDPKVVLNPPAGPTDLTAAFQAGPQVALSWTDTPPTGPAMRSSPLLRRGVGQIHDRHAWPQPPHLHRPTVLATTPLRLPCMPSMPWTPAFSNVAAVNGRRRPRAS